MLSKLTSIDRKKLRWSSPHLLPASALCVGILLGALLAPGGTWRRLNRGGSGGSSGSGGGLHWEGDLTKHRLVVFYHVYVANNWQVLFSHHAISQHQSEFISCLACIRLCRMATRIASRLAPQKIALTA